MRRTWTQLVHPRLLADRYGEEMGHAIANSLIEQAQLWCERNGYTPTSNPEITFTPDSGWARLATIEVSFKIEPIWTGVWGSVRGALLEDGLLPMRDGPDPTAAPSGPPVGTIHVGIDPAAETVGDMAWFMWDGHVWKKLPGGRVVEPHWATDPPESLD
jgi:hypothetical protein